MTTVKVKFRPSTVLDRTGSIIYLITHRRIVRQITTSYKVYPNEWDVKHSMVTILGIRKTDNKRRNTILLIAKRMRQDLEWLNAVIGELSGKGTDYTSDDVVAAFEEFVQLHSFKRFMEEDTIDKLKQLKKERTAETYTSALNSFMRFRCGKDVLFEEITSDLMMEYEAWLKFSGVKMNTVSFYNRILRAVYNRAIEKELVTQCYPFKHVYTGIDKTVKRAITLEGMKRIKELDLSSKLSLDFARDMFLFSFYTRGMSFVDMAYLKKSDLQNGILTYKRRKTKQTLCIKWLKPMQDIIDKYSDKDSEYLLPIIKANGNERLQYRNALRLVNNKLKVIGELAGLHTKLTMYTSRHSWASIAHDQNIPLSVISDGMGHESENTTLIYLASLDTSKVDKANEKILENL